MIILWTLLSIAAAAPVPVYPRQMTYKCTMRVKPGIKDIFAGNNFTGTHYLNAEKKVMRTEWLMTCPKSCGEFGPSPTSVGINAHGEEQAMYQTFANLRLPPGPGGALAAQCHKLPLHSPVFNESWAQDAVYRGVHYLEGRLCHRWSNTVPWAIQRVQRISDYYSDFYTNLPVASISEDGAIDLRYYDISTAPVPEELFDVSGLNCSSP
eukprot:CAMPEP_0181405674 /NCGR_PEP_ID=MMETSP1110-20121109/4879_1 /TAXON_ID=174948 /ORGANISM="Symbiodinium sp., Strain CCMP421" /LENGTH=208 /DNA_ID=CAMNT_0023528065 /DNA_START=11 /DNA_END=634 /DNA_ORIENTATION=-